MERIDYWFEGYEDGHNSTFKLDGEYEFIKGRVRLDPSVSIVKILIPLSKVLNKSIKETKVWLDGINAKGWDKDWFDIPDIETVRNLNSSLRNQIEFKACTVEEAKEIKISVDYYADRDAELNKANEWLKTLSKEERGYVDAIVGSLAPKACGTPS